MVTIREQIMSVVKAAAKHAAAGFPMASDEEKERRASICAGCPSLMKEEYRCGECRCFLRFKIPMETNTCPLGKWSKKEEIKNDNTNE